MSECECPCWKVNQYKRCAYCICMTEHIITCHLLPWTSDYWQLFFFLQINGEFLQLGGVFLTKSSCQFEGRLMMDVHLRQICGWPAGGMLREVDWELWSGWNLSESQSQIEESKMISDIHCGLEGTTQGSYFLIRGCNWTLQDIHISRGGGGGHLHISVQPTRIHQPLKWTLNGKLHHVTFTPLNGITPAKHNPKWRI